MKSFFRIIFWLVSVGTALYGGYILGERNGFELGQSNSKAVTQMRSAGSIKKELLAREEANIINLLNVDWGLESETDTNALRPTLLHFIEGTITSQATVATAKTVRIKLLYLANDKAHLGDSEHTFNDAIQPGRQTSFRIPTSLPKGCVDIAVSIVNVDVDEQADNL